MPTRTSHRSDIRLKCPSECGQMVPLVEARVSGLSLFQWHAYQGHHTAPTYGWNARLSADRWSR
ncbi:hypothetical protein DPMN_068122 [Dreissena polymorpha]|uniref:Uncharacterized protein n=1 Tax=Dreissena polymorpha TaxID=45954 RepID=A0A9D4BTC2_DREPO|nr:hypothetical protein DPMN_068122 [Dreissena polymorpha]